MADDLGVACEVFAGIAVVGIGQVTADQATIMLDANQKWSLGEATRIDREFQAMNPYWVEEPLHPDDVLAHAELARALSPTAIALGEHVSHSVLFKNFMQAKAMQFCQVDCTRVGGVSEFILVALMAKSLASRWFRMWEIWARFIGT